MKLLCGILNSTASRVESLSEAPDNATSADTAGALESSLRFLVEAMAFLNAFVQSAADLRSQVVIQWEVEEASLNVHALSQVREPHPERIPGKKKRRTLISDEEDFVFALMDSF